MSENNPKASRPLLLITVLLCLLCGYLFTHTSAYFSTSASSTEPDMFIAEQNPIPEAVPSKAALPEESQNISDPETTIVEETEEPETGSDESEEPVIENADKEDTVTADSEKEIANAEAVAQTSPAKALQASPEAAIGIWTSAEGKWVFLVNETPYTGWLIDTDGHEYYFDPNGYMMTGWIEDNEKKYYLDLDGIKQYGTITVNGTEYKLQDDGSLAEEASQDTSAPSRTKDEKQNTPAPAAEKTSEQTEKEEDRLPAEQKFIALTFDDGPSQFTNRLLDCLEANQAKATFFLVGQEIQNFSDTLPRMEALGCEIGNHSFGHPDFLKLKKSDIKNEINAVNDIIKSLVGHKATAVRPPYGNIDDNVRLIKAPLILWSVDTLDWSSKNKDAVIEETLNNITDGSVVLMHDLYESTIEAVEYLIPELKKQGYQFCTVHELAAIKGIELVNGQEYNSF